MSAPAGTTARPAYAPARATSRPAPVASAQVPAGRLAVLRRLGPLALAAWIAYAGLVVLVPDATVPAGSGGHGLGASGAAFTAPHAPLLGLVAAGTAVLAGRLAYALRHPASPSASRLARQLPWALALAAWFVVWQVTTVKTGWLAPPYFVAPEVLIQAAAGDWSLLLRCLASSAGLFAAGYVLGTVAGFLTGVLMGWSPRADYWLHPLLETVGPVPAASLLPLAVLLAPSTFASAVFIVAFGAWFPMATMTRAGVRSVPRSFVDVARTLGAHERFLITRVAVPSALPDVLTGLFTALGTALAALMTAELVGVDQGLAWYISWVKGWADYPRMYVGLAVLIVLCRFLMVALFTVRSSLLAWQRDLVRW